MPVEDSNPLHPVGSKRLAGLDGMRAISIVLVLLSHSASTVPMPVRWHPFIGPLLSINGRLGVSAFFVLSGYLITYLLRKEFSKSGSISLKGFYTRRVLRIFPALYTYIIMVSILSAVGLIHTTRRDILGASSFLTNYRFLFSRDVKGDDFWFVAHFWTLSLEEQFYLLWPITIVLLGFFRARYVALGLIVACPFIRVISYLLWPASAMVDYLPRMLHSGSDLIMVGCLLALLEGNPLMEKAVTARWSAVWALLAALFVLFPSALLAVHFRGYYSFTIGNSFNAVLIAYVLMYIIRHPDSLGTRVLEIGFLRWLGTLSYSLYLWQQMFLRGDEVKPMDHFPLRLVACFAAAVASSYLIERPFLKLRGRMSDRKPVYTSGTSEIGIGDLGVSTRG